MASGLLPKSPVSSSLCDEVPHIFIQKSHLEPREFLISSAKRLLQHNRHKADNPTAPTFVRSWTIADIAGFWLGTVCPLMTHQRHCRAGRLYPRRSRVHLETCWQILPNKVGERSLFAGMPNFSTKIQLVG